jgi:Protein of unknown function (DUF993)
VSIASTRRLELPRPDGTLETYATGEPAAFERPTVPLRSRVFYAAAHVVCDSLAPGDPSGPARLDWQATLAYRRHLWSWGLGVAEAMDTAQRGMGLDWNAARELIRRSVAEARAAGGEIACGAGTDQLPTGRPASLHEIRDAYLQQVGFIEGQGGRAVIMASRALAAAARGPDDYRSVYDAVLAQAERPVILHWLGEQFDPQLRGYWGARDLDGASAMVLELIADNAARIDGIKTSLLDAEREVALRRALPAGVRLYTGDDLNYPELIRGDGEVASDALLGVFDAIAPAASAALQALDAGNPAGFDERLAPTLPLARLLFEPPTPSYKTGIVFLAYLNGHQRHFRMVGGLESARSALHLSEVFRLADRAGLLREPDLAVERMRRVLALAGVGT